MGAFNELILDGKPARRVQFKYGLCWQHEYRVGEKVKWETIKRPAVANGGVVISGIASSSLEGASDYFSITILNDRIISASEISEEEFDRLERHLIY